MSESKNINVGLIQPLIKDFPLPNDRLTAFSYISLEEYPIHSHVHMELVYVMSGSLSVKVGVSNYVLKAGEFTIINPFELHALYATDEPNKTCILEINTDFYDPCVEGTIFVSSYSLYRNAAGKDFPKIINLLKKIFVLHLSCLSEQKPDVLHLPTGVVKNDEEYEKILLRSLINYLEIHFTHEYFLLSDHKENDLRDNVLQANRLKSILVYFYEHFPQKIQLQDVADIAFVNRYYISHLVKSGIGFTFSELLQHIRIEKSEIYLLGTDMPINQIVFELGFSSYRYFSQHFKKLFDITPTAYRKKYMHSTIRYKSVSPMASTTASEIKSALDFFSKESVTITENSNDAVVGGNIFANSDPIAIKALLDSANNAKIPPSTYEFPCTHILYDSPYMPAVLLKHMQSPSAISLEKYKKFFTPEPKTLNQELFSGMPGNITHSGIKKSTFYLKEFLDQFAGNKSAFIPGLIASESDDAIKLLIYNDPENMPENLNDDMDIQEIIKNTTSKTIAIDLSKLTNEDSIIYEKKAINQKLDTFSQWNAMGRPDNLSQQAIKHLNDASKPSSVFQKHDLKNHSNICAFTINPFEVILIIFYKIKTI